MEALDEDRKHASEALVYIGRRYGIENEMREAGLGAEAIRKCRQKESYPVIRKFEGWMDSVSSLFMPKSRMGRALVYTYALLPRLGCYGRGSSSCRFYFLKIIVRENQKTLMSH